MDGLISLWTKLSPARKAVVAITSVAVFVAVLVLGRMNPGPDMSLLFGGMEPSTAGEVVSSLEAQGVKYEVRGSAIYVETSRRDQLRLTLASEGLPANGGQGYELLDNLSGFGTTSQMFDAAYWRAKEGELARTILASSYIRSARVHISTPNLRSFQRNQKATAAVTVTTSNGGLSAGQARALKYLVASSVPGLSPDDVAVIDGEGGLIASAEEAGAGSNAEDREQQIRDRVQRLLEARVGLGNAVVEVSVDTVNETESIVERRFDPESRVAISTEVEERTNSSQDSGSGDVTVASNLPDGEAGGSGGSASSQNSESRQLTNYEVSETQREILRTPGAIRRLTVAVLVNNVAATDDAGNEIIEARDPEEMGALRELVASAVGFDESRGDVITLQSMAFEPIVPLGTEAQDPLSPGLDLNIMSLIQIAVLGVVALILGLFVVRPILMSNQTNVLALPGDGSSDGQGGAFEGERPLAIPMAQLDSNAVIEGEAGSAGDDPVTRLRQMIDDRQDETLQILQSWMEDPKDETEKA